MKEITDLGKIKDDISMLKHCVDPETCVEVEDTILKSKYNQELLGSIIIILDEVQRYRNKNSFKETRKKRPFNLSDENKNSIVLSSEPISISRFTYMLNEPINNSVMKKIRATQITNWLLNTGYLCECAEESNKMATQKGNELGISVSIINEKGESYSVCLYNENAQRFILEHINEIAED